MPKVPLNRHSWLATLPGIAVSLLPSVTCPACWPAYAGLLSSLLTKEKAVMKRSRKMGFALTMVATLLAGTALAAGSLATVTTPPESDCCCVVVDDQFVCTNTGEVLDECCCKSLLLLVGAVSTAPMTYPC